MADSTSSSPSATTTPGAKAGTAAPKPKPARAPRPETETAREARLERERVKERNRLWREQRAREAAEAPARPRPNPLLDLAEEKRAKLFAWLRECPYDDAVRHVLKDDGIGDVTRAELTEFFQREAECHWNRRLERAALEANALMQLAEQHPAHFSSSILAALGQEAFRQIASGEGDPAAINRLSNLFLKARSDRRAEQLLALKREKQRDDSRSLTERALEAFARELPDRPEARRAFEGLRRALAEDSSGAADERIDGRTE